MNDNLSVKINFAEFIEEKKNGQILVDAFRVYAKVKDPIKDIRTRGEWEEAFNKMLNTPIKE